MAFTQVTITQDYDLADGLDPSGTVSFTPLLPMVNSGVQVPAVKVTRALDIDGILSITLDANTDPDTVPANTSYLVEELIGGVVRRYSVRIPHDAGPTIVLSSLAPASPAPVLTATAQPLDADLTVISGLTPTNDDVLQRKSGAWTNRSMAQLAADLGVILGGQTSPNALTAVSGVITPDASVGTLWRYTATGAITLAPPTSGADGDLVFVEISASGGAQTLSFQGGVPDPVTIASGAWWTGAFRYHAAPDDLWVLDDGASGSGSAGYTDEDAQDAVATAFAAGTHTNVTVTYNDASNSLSLAATGSAVTDAIARGLGGASVLAADSFTRANAALGTADSGLVWEQQVGTFSVSSNKATSVVDSVALLDVGTSDVDVSCLITVAATGAPGIVYRAGDTSNRFELRCDSSAGFTLVRLDNAVSTVIVSSPQTFTSGQTYHVRMVASNNGLRGYLNGTLRLTANLSAAAQTEFGAYTKVGLRQPTTQAGILWNDFVVARSFNDYGGTIAPAGQTASYTLVLSDAGKAVEMDVATANNCTVPPNSSVGFPIGTVIEVAQVNTGQTTIVAGAGVTLSSPGGLLALRTRYSTASLRKRALDSWLVTGDVA